MRCIINKQTLGNQRNCGGGNKIGMWPGIMSSLGEYVDYMGLTSVSPRQ